LSGFVDAAKEAAGTVSDKVSDVAHDIRDKVTGGDDAPATAPVEVTAAPAATTPAAGAPPVTPPKDGTTTTPA
jgi:hypothetical protein